MKRPVEKGLYQERNRRAKCVGEFLLEEGEETTGEADIDSDDEKKGAMRPDCFTQRVPFTLPPGTN